MLGCILVSGHYRQGKTVDDLWGKVFPYLSELIYRVQVPKTLHDFPNSGL